MKNQRFHRRLANAASGIWSAWRSEASFRLQVLATGGVLAVLVWRQPVPLWWACLLTNCAMVLAAELLNSALEATIDHLHPARHPAIRVAKDCAAGAVLLLSTSAVGVFIAFVLDTMPG